MAIMESKRTGTCNICRGEIKVGELINWNRNDGASHYQGCEPQVATKAEREAYAKHLNAELKAWDGVGSFRPTAYGDFIDQKTGRAAK